MNRTRLLAVSFLLTVIPLAAKAETAAMNLSDEQLEALAKKTGEEVKARAVLKPSARKLDGGAWTIPQPFAKSVFWVLTLPTVPGKPTGPSLAREFIATLRDGQVVRKAGSKTFEELLKLEDTSKWKDAQFVEAAQLYVHLSAMSNQDGWVLLKKPEDLTSIKVNMEAVGDGIKARDEAAKGIKEPSVTRKEGEVTVRIFAWHLIGGFLKEHTLTFGAAFSAKEKALGTFGGGGYD